MVWWQQWGTHLVWGVLLDILALPPHLVDIVWHLGTDLSLTRAVARTNESLTNNKFPPTFSEAGDKINELANSEIRIFCNFTFHCLLFVKIITSYLLCHSIWCFNHDTNHIFCESLSLYIVYYTVYNVHCPWSWWGEEKSEWVCLNLNYVNCCQL